MIFDLEHGDLPSHHATADICIVGAGAAGIVLALELTHLGKKVLLLEAGGRSPEPRSQEIYRSEIVGLPHNGVHTGRCRTYGGTTTKWGGQILELDPIDFAHRAWVKDSGWPIAKQDLLPDYRRAIHYEGLDGALQVDDEVWRAADARQPAFNDDLLPYFSRWCPEPNLATLHRRTLAENPSPTIVLHANLVKVRLAADGACVEALECRTLDGRKQTFSAEQYVLAVGAIEVSRLLLNWVATGQEVWNSSGLLGKHFQDHIDREVAQILPRNQKQFHEYFDNFLLNGYKYHPKLKLAPQQQQEQRLLNVAATMVFRSDADEATHQMKRTARKILRGSFSDLSPREVAHLPLHLPLLLKQLWSYQVRNRIYNPPDAQLFLRVHCEQQPDSASTITLSEERDELGMQRARLDWQVSDLEMNTITAYTKIAQQVFGDTGFATLVLDETLQDPATRRRKCDDSNHHMGGTRMSTLPQDGVVDTDLRVHGAKNLYLCSSSVFPTSGFSNPTHTLLALAIRLARHLAVP